MKRCFREQSLEHNGESLDIMGVKCLLFRLTGKNIKRGEIIEVLGEIGIESMGATEIDLPVFEKIFHAIRQRHYITVSGSILNNLYSALDEGRKGYVDEERLAKTMIRAGCPILASTRAHDAFSRKDELQIGKTSITQTHSILEAGASIFSQQGVPL